MRGRNSRLKPQIRSSQNARTVPTGPNTDAAREAGEERAAHARRALNRREYHEFCLAANPASPDAFPEESVQSDAPADARRDPVGNPAPVGKTVLLDDRRDPVRCPAPVGRTVLLDDRQDPVGYPVPVWKTALLDDRQDPV